MPYLVHASLLFALSFCFYWLLLRRETFFKLNRKVLICSIFISMLLPLISIPEAWSLRKKEVETSAIARNISQLEPKKEISRTEPLPSIAPIQTPQETTNTATHTVAPIETNNLLQKLDLKTSLYYLYLIGLGVFGLTFLAQLMILIAKMTSLNSMQDGKYRIVELVKDEAPYSFFNAIFINPAKYDPDTFEQIIDHEKIHIKQVHFFDKMLAEFALIVFWFNPFVWLYRRAITNNLEYLTDESMLQKGTEKQSYQMSLLQVSVPQHALNLTTNYNQSFLKDRITMMNAKKSSARSFWKYLFILPLFALSMMSMNDVIFEKNTLPEYSPDGEKTALAQDSIPSDSERQYYLDENGEENLANEEGSGKHTEFDAQTAAWKDRQNRTVFSKKQKKKDKEGFHISADEDGFEMYAKDGKDKFEMKIKDGKFEMKAYSKDKDKTKSMKMDASNGLSFSGDWGDFDSRPGTWQGEIDGNRICLQINNSSPARNNYWIQTACFDKSEFSSLPRNTPANFYIEREAGRLNLSGDFGKNDFGSGDFDFVENKDFADYLRGEGIKLRDDLHSELFRFFIADIDRNYVRDMQSSGLDIDGHLLSELAIHGVSKEYIAGMEKAGLRGSSTRKIIEAKIHSVTPTYAQEMADIGFSDLSLQNLIEFKIHGVNADLVEELNAAGFRNLSAHKIKEAAVHNVSADYIKDLKKAGYKADNLDEVIHSKIHGVSSDYVAQFAKLGYDTSNLDEIQECKIHGVSPEYIREIKNTGFSNLSLEEAKNLKIHGVSADYIRRVNKMGFGNLSLDDILGARIHGLSANYLEDMKSLGFKNLKFDDAVGAKIHGVNPSFIQDLRDEGMNENDLEEYVGAKIHGVTASYIARAKKAGYNLPDLEDYVDLKIRKGSRL